jgi:phosphoribosylformylglycinamidine cyclo-ligase
MPIDAVDVAGCAIGVVERDLLIERSTAEPGDLVVGLASSGLHANGFSLVRSLLVDRDIPLDRSYQEQLRLSLGDAEADAAIAAEPQHALVSIGHVLLDPTRIYAPAVLDARSRLRAAGRDVRGIAHITGGGLPGNVPRALPDGLAARLDPTRWPMPSVMRLLGALGGIEDDELRATFNGGIGMALVLPPDAAHTVLAAAADAGIAAWVVGEVIPSEEAGGARYVEGPLESVA